jgi:TPR repeat protein
MRAPLRAAIPLLVVATGLAVFAGWHLWRKESLARRERAEAQAVRVEAERGDPEAQLKLGSMYFNGRGVAQNYAEAARWYRQSADQGYEKAEYNLGYLFHFGQGVPHSEPEALRWCLLAAAQNDRKAEAAVGSMYHNGEGVKQDDAEALRWFRRAAELGDPFAENSLGMTYLEGRMVPRDNAEAVRWFRKAADQGDAIGEYDLSTMYAAGLGVPFNRTEENRLLRRAAMHGDSVAQRDVTLPLTLWRRLTLVAFMMWNLWIFTEFFYQFPAFANNPVRKRRESVLAAFALFSAVGASVTWYGYAKHQILRLGFGMNAFTACRWLLDIFALCMLVYILRSGKHPEPAQPTENGEPLATSI